METTKRVEIGKAVGYGWDSIKKDFWYFVGIALMYSVISGITSGGGDHDHQRNWGLLGIFISAWMTAGYLKLVLSYYDGKQLPFSDLFTQLKYFWRVLGATLLIGLITLGGLILLIVPGIYWAIRYSFTINFIVDKDMDIIEAMGASAKLTEGVKWKLLGFGLTMIGIVILGAIVLGVGILVAIPITWLADIYIYKHLLGKTANKEEQKDDEEK